MYRRPSTHFQFLKHGKDWDKVVKPDSTHPTQLTNHLHVCELKTLKILHTNNWADKLIDKAKGLLNFSIN